MKQFHPIHNYELLDNGVTDEVTLSLVKDTLALYRSLYQGMPPIGEWIQARVAELVRAWLPGWEVSHGQIADLNDLTIQSRSWDLMVHRVIPQSWGFPPPASPSGPWPLVPKELCCAVIDTKGRYNDPIEYSQKNAFNSLNNCKTRQLEFLGAEIIPILFILASNVKPNTVEAKGESCGIPSFVIAKAIDHKPNNGKVNVEWILNSGKDNILPISRFKDTLILAAKKWDFKNKK